jgi:ornithine cyclodeaminase
MIYLIEEDILRAASIDKVLNAIETSMRLYEQKAFYMPQRMGVDYEKNTLLLMPCFIKDCF